jgi:alpha-tubulin suppressor-like RCC1 family protein
VILSFGDNFAGKLGLGISSDTDVSVAAPIIDTNFSGQQVAQISAGNSHSLLLTQSGTVLAFGSSSYTGQGTVSVFGTPIATPIVNTNLAGKITQISAGGFTSLILDEFGTAYVFGSDVRGNTGMNSGSEQKIAVPIVTTNLGGRRIKQVAAGALHSLLLAEDGTVFSFGANDDGRTGDGVGGINSRYVAEPIVATNLVGKNIVQIAAGAADSLLLADDGSVFSFGSNASIQLGRSTASASAAVATQIDTTELAGKHIKQIATGASYNLLLADDGTVFTFGWNSSSGGSGRGNQFGSNVATPIDATNLGGKTITKVDVGYWHSLLLASDGTVFSFGQNTYGATGLGTFAGNAFRAIPIDMSNFGGMRAVDGSAGVTHSLVVLVPEPCALFLGFTAIAVVFNVRKCRRLPLRQ